MPAAHFGVTIPQIKRTWDESKSASREFEAMGYDSLWVCDHLYGPQSPSIPILEAWSLLGAVAAVTERVELGTLVTPAGMRNPAQLGKIIATVDNIAGGRVIAGLGAGWMPREFTDFGVPFLAIAPAPRPARETVQLLEADVERAGGHVRRQVRARATTSSASRSRRASVPILIGGGGEKVDAQARRRGSGHLEQPRGPAGASSRARSRPCAATARPSAAPSNEITDQPAVPRHHRAGRGRAPGRDRHARRRSSAATWATRKARWRSPAARRRCASRSRSTSTSAARCS